MRSPVGELLSIAGRALTRPRNDSAVAYVAQRDTRYGTGSASTGVTGDPTSAIEAPGFNGTLFSIIDKLSTGTAALDWHLHRIVASGDATCDLCGSADDAPRGVELVQAHPALSVWDRPNDFFTPALFVESFQQHLDLVGEGWWVVAYLANRPIELWPVRPDRMAPVRDPKKFISGYVYRSPDGQLVPLSLREVVYLRKPAPWDSYRGAGAAQTLMAQLYGAKYAAEWNTRFFQNSAIPGGVIEIPIHLGPDEWEELQLRWAETHRGVSNAHTVATLEHGAKWVDTNYSMRDMQFPELRRVTREEVREAFGIHGSVLGLTEDVNRSNAETGDAQFARHLIVPRAERIKDALNGPYLQLFGKDQSKKYAFAYANPVPDDREAANAERTSKAQAFSTLKAAGVHPEDAAQVAGLPKMRIVATPQPSAPPGREPAAAGARDADAS